MHPFPVRMMVRAAILTALALATMSAAYAERVSSRPIPHWFIVTWEPGFGPDHARESVTRAGGQLTSYHRHTNGAVVYLPTAEAEARFRQNPHLTSIVPDSVILPNTEQSVFTPDFNCLDCGGGGNPNPQVIPAVVSHVGASPGSVPYTGAGIGVAVIDTGIWFAHRDFARTDGTNVLAQNWYQVGQVVYSCWRGEVLLPNCGDSEDSNGGHGTAVAGVIGAADNTVDLVGVAPRATIFDFNVTTYNSELCSPAQHCLRESYVVDALQWILDHHNSTSPHIEVINMSFGRPLNGNPNPDLEGHLALLAAQNVIAVTAAGNDQTTTATQRVPANSPNVIAVASTSALLGSDSGAPCNAFPHVPADTASWYTTDGAFSPVSLTGVSISAPGEDREDYVERGNCSNDANRVCLTNADCDSGATCTITMCAPYHVGAQLLKAQGGIMRAAGTSVSSPVVAGVVALMKQRAASLNQTLSLQSARTLIRDSAMLRTQIPYDSPYTPANGSGYTFDGEREGIVWAPGATQ